MCTVLRHKTLWKWWDFTDVTLVGDDTYWRLDLCDSSNWGCLWRWRRWTKLVSNSEEFHHCTLHSRLPQPQPTCNLQQLLHVQRFTPHLWKPPSISGCMSSLDKKMAHCIFSYLLFVCSRGEKLVRLGNNCMWEGNTGRLFPYPKFLQCGKVTGENSFRWLLKLLRLALTDFWGFVQGI